jgi:hypothetical protein
MKYSVGQLVALQDKEEAGKIYTGFVSAVDEEHGYTVEIIADGSYRKL